MPTPYAGNQNNYPASVNILSGSDTPSSGNFITAYEGGLDRTAYLMSRLWATALDNWQAPLAVSSSAFNTGSTDSFGAGVGVSWEPLYGTWRVFLNAVGASQTQLWDSADGGKTFAKIAVQPSVQNTISGASALGESLWVVGNGTSTVASFVGVSTSLSVTSFTGPQPATSAVTWYSTALSVWFTFSINQSGGSFSDGVLSPTSLSAITGTVTAGPTGWNSGTNHVGQLLMAQSSAVSLVALCGVTSGTDAARVMTVTGTATTPVMTDITPAFLGTTYVITGLAYDAIEAVWALLVYNGANSYLYTSPDLGGGSGPSTTWTQIFVWAGVQCRGLAIAGDVGVSTWAVGVPFPNGSVHNANRVQISTNITGGSPAFFNTSMIVPPSGSPQTFNIVSSGNQLAVVTPGNVCVSQKCGLL
jgi:hypothetical protein